MRDKVSVFYYPSMIAYETTLKKAILLFDELHFIDTVFHVRQLWDGRHSIFAACIRAIVSRKRRSSLRAYPRDGPVYGEFLEQVRADVNDPEFLKRFQQSKVLTACRVELELR